MEDRKEWQRELKLRQRLRWWRVRSGWSTAVEEADATKDSHRGRGVRVWWWWWWWWWLGGGGG